MLRKTTSIVLLALLISSATLMFAVYRAQAAETMKVYVDPPQIINEALTPGTLFNISIKVANIPVDPGAVGFELNLTWDSNILKGVSMQEVIFHEVTPEAEWSNIWKLKHVVAPNSISYAYTFQDIDAAIAGGYAPISGNHTIAEIRLNVTGIGKTPLQFFISKVGDPNANAMPHDTFDGLFDNTPPPPPPSLALLYVEPAKIANANLTTCNNFTISVYFNGTGLAGLEFKLGFNATALHANSITRGSFIPGSVTPDTAIDNTAGFVKFNASLPTPLDGNGPVADIEFHVEADNVKNSTLHLYDVTLTDGTGQLIPFTTKDGSFTNVRTIPGDLNEDGIVDIRDAILASHAFGSSLGEPDYNPLADLNEDGTVDIFDIIILVKNFGHTA